MASSMVWLPRTMVLLAIVQAVQVAQKTQGELSEQEPPRIGHVPLRHVPCELGPLPVRSLLSRRVPRTQPYTPPTCQVRPEKLPMVFVHSLPKMGTTSLSKAMKEFGFRDCPEAGRDYIPFEYGPKIYELHGKLSVSKFGETPKELEDEIRWSLAGLKARVEAEPCDSFSDYPMGHAQGLDIRIKMALWPEAKYIWVERSADDWIASLLHFRSSHGDDSPEGVFLRERFDECTHFMHKVVMAAPGKFLSMQLANISWESLLPFLGMGDCTGVDNDFPKANAKS